MVKKKVRSKKVLKKNFYEIEVPMTAVKVHLYGSSVDDLDGRTIKLDLTKSLRGKSLELKMRVKSDGEKLTADPISVELVASYIRRNMRRGTDYVEDSFDVNCRDAVARTKIFLITRRRVSRAVRKALRDAARKYVEKHIKIRDKKEVFSDILANKLQKSITLTLKKIYPLALCEIKAFKVISVREEDETVEDKQIEEIKKRKEVEKVEEKEKKD